MSTYKPALSLNALRTMPDHELIHSAADVTSALEYGLDSGLELMLDQPQDMPRPRILTRRDIPNFDRGTFFLYRPEWVYGPWKMMRLTAGLNKGKFFVQPRVNFSPISLHFNGETIVEGRRRFGAGVISIHSDWLEHPAQALRATPRDVELRFKRMVTHLSSGLVIKAHVHRYIICRGVIASPDIQQSEPPFDFIPWGRDVLQ